MLEEIIDEEFNRIQLMTGSWGLVLNKLNFNDELEDGFVYYHTLLNETYKIRIWNYQVFKELENTEIPF